MNRQIDAITNMKIVAKMNESWVYGFQLAFNEMIENAFFMSSLER